MIPVLTVDVRAASVLSGLRNAEKRISYAVANALNDTVKAIQRAEREHVVRAFTVRRQDFIGREAAKISGTDWASAPAGRLQARVAAGQKPRLLLSEFEEGGTRRPFAGRRIAVPLTGGPARPSFAAQVPAALRITRLNLVKTTAAGIGLRRRSGRSRRMRADVDFTTTATRSGKVQIKGQRRTFILEQTARAPEGGVYQRVGPRRDDVRLVYPFVPPARLDRRLRFVETADRVARAAFRSYLDFHVDETIRRAFA